MAHTIAHDDPAAQVDALAHTKVRDCYQCGKCSAGCPMAEKMDVLPNQLLRLVQLGKIDKAAASEAIWLCVSCLTCSTRCPKSVDCAGVMDALRQIALEKERRRPGLAANVSLPKGVFGQRPPLRTPERSRLGAEFQDERVFSRISTYRSS